jgi:3-hydroxyacyl-CoA dehydrogenase
MNLDERFEQVTVIGAAGKMGCGISLLLAQEMARLKNLPENRGRTYRLNLIDARGKGLEELLEYIRIQSAKQANRKIEAIRPLPPSIPPKVGGEGGDVRTDEQIVRAFVADTLSVIRTSTALREARNSRLVFEAVPEREPLKIDILKQLKETCPGGTFFLSNTSSIPIGFLDREAGLGGRIIGFHFYNPPPVQKLVELIPAQTTRPELTEMAHEIARRLGKTAVPSRDIAGFIGNGHFVRDALHAIGEVEEGRFSGSLTLPAEFEVLYALNKVSQEGLLRPMGIFQLIDYVGLDVFSSIMQVMARHINVERAASSFRETFHADLIGRMLSKKVLGGQHPDGSQKDGFFQYKGRQLTGVYALDQEAYISLQNGAMVRTDRALGALGIVGWKELLNAPDRARKLRDHFARLAALDTLGAQLTMAYLSASRRIGEKLVSDGVAESPEDVNTVLVSGFGHLYGPFNDYVMHDSVTS